MFSRTVHARERLFVKQYSEIVLARNFLHQIHQQKVMIVGQVAFLKNGRTFKLVRGHLVVTGCNGNTQFQGLHFKFPHECIHALGNRTEIMVLQLLAFGGSVPEKRPSRHHEIWPRIEQSLVHEKIFLFPP